MNGYLETDNVQTFVFLAVSYEGQASPPAARGLFASGEETQAPFPVAGARATSAFNWQLSYTPFLVCLKEEAIHDAVLALPAYRIEAGGEVSVIRVLVVFRRGNRPDEWEATRTVIVPATVPVIARVVEAANEPYGVRAFAALWLMELDPAGAFKTMAARAEGLHLDRNGSAGAFTWPFEQVDRGQVTAAAEQVAQQADASPAARKFATEYLDVRRKSLQERAKSQQ